MPLSQPRLMHLLRMIRRTMVRSSRLDALEASGLAVAEALLTVSAAAMNAVVVAVAIEANTEAAEEETGREASTEVVVVVDSVAGTAKTKMVSSKSELLVTSREAVAAVEALAVSSVAEMAREAEASTEAVAAKEETEVPRLRKSAPLVPKSKKPKSPRPKLLLPS